MSTKKTSGTEKFIMFAIVYGLAHWSVAGFAANNLFQECNDRSQRFNSALCDCTKSAFRLSPYPEFFLIGAALEDEGIANKLAQGLHNSKRRCQIELGL